MRKSSKSFEVKGKTCYEGGVERQLLEGRHTLHHRDEKGSVQAVKLEHRTRNGLQWAGRDVVRDESDVRRSLWSTCTVLRKEHLLLSISGKKGKVLIK